MEGSRRPLVSIVVPIYKVEDYLPRCLDSICKQTYRNLEIVLVNDGSPDGCGDIMQAYAERDPRIVMIFQENQGLGMARNNGIAAATGEYVALVDSDDYIHPTFVARLWRAIEREDADVAVCNFFFELPSGTKIPWPLMTAKRRFTGEDASQETLLMFSIPTFAWNKLYKRELFAEFKFPSIYYEDVATIAKLLTRARHVATTRRPLYYYCFRKGGITGNFKAKNVRDYLNAVGMIRQFLWDEGRWQEYRKPYRKFIRRVEAQLLVTIQMQRHVPQAKRLKAMRLVSAEMDRLREAPMWDANRARSVEGEDAFGALIPRSEAPPSLLSRMLGRPSAP